MNDDDRIVAGSAIARHEPTALPPTGDHDRGENGGGTGQD